jgi:hypothetical protein
MACPSPKSNPHGVWVVPRKNQIRAALERFFTAQKARGSGCNLSPPLFNLREMGLCNIRVHVDRRSISKPAADATSVLQFAPTSVQLPGIYFQNGDLDE